MHRIPLAGVIGNPVAHSASPRLHGHWLSEYGISGHYVPLHVEAENLAQVLRALPHAGFVGVNVTVPHKEAVLALASQVTPVAKRIGAANTLTFMPDGGFEADNTDAYGFAENLRRNAPGWDPSAGPAVVFGAGGAARAVLDALSELGIPEIRLLNRTRTRAEALAASISAPVTVSDWSKADMAVSDAVTVVNTTSLGMTGQPDFPDCLSSLPPGALATDIVYTPLETPFLRLAAAAGARTVDGLGMLLYQGVPGFARWFGVTPEVTDATRQVVLP